MGDFVIDLAAAQREATRSQGFRLVEPRKLPDGTHIEIVDEGPLWERAAHFQYRHYLERGYCKPSDREVVEACEPWRETSSFHTTLDSSGEVIGVMRSVTGAYSDLPIGKVESTPGPFADHTCTEAASLSVSAKYATAGVVEALYRSVFEHGVRSSATAMVALVRQEMLRLLRRFYGLPYVELGPGQWYMGSDDVPVGATTEDLCVALGRNRPNVYSWFLESFTAEEVVRLDLPVVLPPEDPQSPLGPSGPLGQAAES